MKTEQLKEWGLTEEQVKLVFAENGKDVSKAKNDFETEKKKRIGLETDILKIKGENTDTATLQGKIDTLEKAIADRKNADEKEVAEKAINERFTTVSSTGKFVNDLTKKGIMDEFKLALEDHSNKGKGDKEIYEALVKDRDGIFASKNPGIDIHGTNNIDTKDIPTKTAMDFVSIVKENQTRKV